MFQKVKQLTLSEFMEERYKLKSHRFTYYSWKRDGITVAAVNTTLTPGMKETMDLASLDGTFETHLEGSIQEC